MQPAGILLIEQDKEFYFPIESSRPNFPIDFFFWGEVSIGKSKLNRRLHVNWNESSRRPYCIENAGSHSNSIAKRCKARVVLGWGTARERQGVDGFLSIFSQFPIEASSR
jgi:hypothetical protein